LLSAALLERWPQVCRVKITFTEIPMNSKLFCFQKKQFDKMRFKLDSTENPHSFEKYPTPP